MVGMENLGHEGWRDVDCEMGTLKDEPRGCGGPRWLGWLGDVSVPSLTAGNSLLTTGSLIMALHPPPFFAGQRSPC